MQFECIEELRPFGGAAGIGEITGDEDRVERALGVHFGESVENAAQPLVSSWDRPAAFDPKPVTFCDGMQVRQVRDPPASARPEEARECDAGPAAEPWSRRQCPRRGPQARSSQRRITIAFAATRARGERARQDRPDADPVGRRPDERSDGGIRRGGLRRPRRPKRPRAPRRALPGRSPPAGAIRRDAANSLARAHSRAARQARSTTKNCSPPIARAGLPHTSRRARGARAAAPAIPVRSAGTFEETPPIQIEAMSGEAPSTKLGMPSSIVQARMNFARLILARSVPAKESSERRLVLDPSSSASPKRGSTIGSPARRRASPSSEGSNSPPHAGVRSPGAHYRAKREAKHFVAEERAKLA